MPMYRYVAVTCMIVMYCIVLYCVELLYYIYIYIRLLQVLSAKYSWIEWGVLFRPDLEGTARYASMQWVEELAEVNRENGSIMR